MRSLLARGARECLNVRGPTYTTALHSALVLGYEESVRILLENGTDTELLNRAGWTALMAAVIAGNHRLSKLLLEHGANVDSKGWNIGETSALHYAAGLGHVKIVELLVERGCDTHSVNMYGANAVQMAFLCGQETMVRHLLQFGEMFGRNDEVGPQEQGLSRYSIFRSRSSLESILHHEVSRS